MDELSPAVRRLIVEKTLPRSQVSAREFKSMRPLLDGGVLGFDRVGRGEVVRVIHEGAFLSWVRRNFPSFGNTWMSPENTARAQAIALRRDSKAGGAAVGKSILHLRTLNDATAEVLLNDLVLPVAQLTRNHGLAACLIDSNSCLSIGGRAALVENLECFIHAERFLSKVTLVLNSAGRVSDRMIAVLQNSRFRVSPLLHAPDYDPVGLGDYVRLRASLGNKVQLWTPPNLEQLFALFGNRQLIATKPRNRALLEQLCQNDMPCEASQRVFQLIKDSGCGLEQESLLLGKSNEKL